MEITPKFKEKEPIFIRKGAIMNNTGHLIFFTLEFALFYMLGFMLIEDPIPYFFVFIFLVFPFISYMELEIDPISGDLNLRKCLGLFSVRYKKISFNQIDKFDIKITGGYRNHYSNHLFLSYVENEKYKEAVILSNYKMEILEEFCTLLNEWIKAKCIPEQEEQAFSYLFMISQVHEKYARKARILGWVKLAIFPFVPFLVPLTFYLINMYF